MIHCRRFRKRGGGGGGFKEEEKGEMEKRRIK